MSFQTWLQEFYPISAEDFSEIKRAYLKLERFIEFTC